jgi:Trehalose receptor
VNLLQQFSWNYGDIFVMLLAMGISFRFKQFNDYFQHVLRNENLMTQSTWRDMRIHYFQLIELLYFIDSQVSMMILLSLGHNMLVLIIKIFNAFK